MLSCTKHTPAAKSIPQGLKALLILLDELPGINPRPTACASSPELRKRQNCGHDKTPPVSFKLTDGVLRETQK
jgi:hypothetical protein